MVERRPHKANAGGSIPPAGKKVMLKIVVFVPKSHAAKVRNAIGETEAARIGNYSHCISEIESTGYFKPEKGAKPSIGKIGKMQRVKEVRLEFVCPPALKTKVVRAIKKVHPYEEVAFDIYKLIS